MANIFSATEVVEIAIQIEKNGRDFYNGAAGVSTDKDAKLLFEFLSREEARHIKSFEGLLSKVKKYDPVEAYPEEYFSYIKTLSGDHIFTKEQKGEKVASLIKTDLEAIELGVALEKDSILFYQEIKKVVLENEHKIIDKLLDEERMHLKKLTGLREKGGL